MIIFYTRYKVINDLDIKKILELTLGCVNGMRNVPNEFKNISWNGEDSGEWKKDKNLLAFEIDSAMRIVSIRIAIVDENDELWTQDIVLDEKNNEIQLRLAREKKIISAEYSKSFNLPYLFKKIIRDGMAGMDYDLPVTDEPVYIDEKNIEVIKNIIVGIKRKYALPIIYVSCPFEKENYEVDINELAKDMAGSAHVLVEKTSKLSQLLRRLTDDKNAYNGAVDVFYDDDSFRYLKRGDITSNQYRYKISHAVYARMSMRNISDVYSLSTLRLKNRMKKLNDTRYEYDKLSLKVEELTAKIEELEDKCRESNDYWEYASGEIKQYEKRINDLEIDNHVLKNKVEVLTEALKRKNGDGIDNITIAFTEAQIYEDEIKRTIIECIKCALASYGDDERKRRDYHVLKNIIANNFYIDRGGEFKERIKDIFKKNRLNKTDIANLKSLGFEEERGGHNKYKLNNDDRYIITVASTPSDYREGENLAHRAINLLFGRY